MNVLENLNFSKAIQELLPKLFGDAFLIVVFVTITSFILALIIGFIMALARISKYKTLNGVIVLFQELIRGTPLLVQLVYVYYVIPLLIDVLAYFVGYEGLDFKMSAVTAGVIGLSINYGTYMSEVIRSAIISIDKGQTEAALALGFSNAQAMFKIVLPQAFKSSVPVLGNYLVMLVKDTSLMAYITAQEFLMTTKSYTSQTFLTIESYTLLAGVYLVICIPLALFIKFIERKLNRNRR